MVEVCWFSSVFVLWVLVVSCCVCFSRCLRLNIGFIGLKWGLWKICFFSVFICVLSVLVVRKKLLVVWLSSL